MHTVSISDAKAKLNKYVEQARATHEHLTITKNGSPAAVMVAADEWESIQETLFWLSQPGVREDVATTKGEYAAGETLSEEQVQAGTKLKGLCSAHRSAYRVLDVIDEVDWVVVVHRIDHRAHVYRPH